ADHGGHDAHETVDDHDIHFHELPRLMMLGPAIIAALSLVAAVLIDQMVNPLLSLVGPSEVHLHLFAGFNEVFWLSMLALALGVVAFLTRNLWLTRTRVGWLSAARAYD